METKSFYSVIDPTYYRDEPSSFNGFQVSDHRNVFFDVDGKRVSIDINIENIDRLRMMIRELRSSRSAGVFDSPHEDGRNCGCIGYPPLGMYYKDSSKYPSIYFPLNANDEKPVKVPVEKLDAFIRLLGLHVGYSFEY